MPLAIVTDSSVSLPPSLIADLPLHVVPMEVHHEGAVYRDGVDLTPDAFYALQARSTTLPTTSAPKPGAFVDAFQRASEHADEIVCVTLSAELSATHEAALSAQREAASSLPSVRIDVVDSRSAGTAEGLIALAAARSARGGSGADEVLARMERWRSAVHLYGYVNSLYYVWRGGRVPRVLMWMGRLLDVKPILQLSHGKIGMVERTRTEPRAMDRLEALAVACARGADVRVAVMHAASPTRAEELAERLRHALEPRELFVTEFTPVIGAHTGPGLVGCAVHRIDDSD